MLPPPYQKIVIIGPSCSGKSSLAVRLGKQLGLPVLHLDQIAHRPGTNWQRRPDDDFIADHDQFLNSHPAWIIEGNYSICMPQRLQQADLVIWCDPPLAGCLWRYCLRCLKADPDRPGKLRGAEGEFNWELVCFTVRQYPKNRKRYQALINLNPHLRVMRLRRFSTIRHLSL